MFGNGSQRRGCRDLRLAVRLTDRLRGKRTERRFRPPAGLLKAQTWLKTHRARLPTGAVLHHEGGVISGGDYQTEVPSQRRTRCRRKAGNSGLATNASASKSFMSLPRAPLSTG
jgi:hypothetical protein